MNRELFFKFIETVEKILKDNGITGEPVQEVILSLFIDLFTAIWEGSSTIRAQYKTRKDFIISVRTEILTRGLVKTRYKRDLVI